MCFVFRLMDNRILRSSSSRQKRARSSRTAHHDPPPPPQRKRTKKSSSSSSSVKKSKATSTIKSSASKKTPASLNLTHSNTAPILHEDDLVWIQCSGSGSQVGKVRSIPKKPTGLYRVNFYGTRTFEYVQRNQLQTFDVPSIPSCLHYKCDGDSEAYRSVYYALESLHRKKLLQVEELPSEIWSVLNLHLNQEESNSDDSDEDDDDEKGEEDSDSSQSCASDDDRVAPGNANGRFRRFHSCLEDPKLAIAATPRQNNNKNR